MRPTIIFVENHTMKKNLFALLVCMTPFCVLAQLPSYLPTDGLVGWWPFNGNANDESGNGNNFNINGALINSDRYGMPNSCYYFDGIDDYLFASGDNLPAAERSVSLWYNSIVVQNQPILIGYGGGVCGQSWFQGFNISQTGGIVIAAHCGINELITPYNINQITGWHNLLITNMQSGMRLYLDGLQIDSIPIFNNSTQTIGTQLAIGVNVSPNGQAPYTDINSSFFNGWLDDIAIYNRALTPEEITALYNASATNGGGGNNTASANVPQGISYQAVARNPQGQPLTNTALQVKFTLLSDSLTGTAEYSELHSLTTNDLGLFTTAFGTGTPLSGTFANIKWASGNKYLKVEMDAGGGFISIGTQQMLSVPYSIRSQSSATIINNALPVYSDNADALAAGLQAGEMYRTATGDLKIVY
jgi:hypothetical protein